MNKIKVVVKLFTQDQFFGFVYLEEGQRVQDLLNDERKFIPFEKTHMERGPNNTVSSSNIVISKDAIALVEER